MNKKELVDMLKTKIVKLEFVKQNGKLRTMDATLLATDEEKTPTDDLIAGNALSVFDTAKQAWRSFRWDSLKSVQNVNVTELDFK